MTNDHLDENGDFLNSEPEEKGLSRFMASLPQEVPEPKSFPEKIKYKMTDMSGRFWKYIRSPEFFVLVRNWLRTNLFYLFPASLAAPLMAYCLMKPDTPRLKYLEYGTLGSLVTANLLSLGIVLVLAWFKQILQTKRVQVHDNPHPFRRLFWHWVGANFIYILPVLCYKTIQNAWYFLEGMERAAVVTNLVIILWVIATVISLSIMSVTAGMEWVFRSLGRSALSKEDELAALDPPQIMDEKSDQ